MRRQWTEEDDAALARAVEACLPMQGDMKGPREVWWAAVCGSLGTMGVFGATPDSARARWQRLQKKKAERVDSAWDDLAERVADYEQSLLEAAAANMAEMQRSMAELQLKVDELHAWFKQELM